jgi:LuxR family capsular biosynthesis transcriptional activator
MPSLIVDRCYYTQLALHSLLQHHGLNQKDILSLTDIENLQTTCNSVLPEIIFINEDRFTLNAAAAEMLRKVISTHPDTLFFILISRENLNYQNYIPISNNIVILPKSVSMRLVGQLISHNLKTTLAIGEEPVNEISKMDLTPVSLSPTEADILKMWMSGHNTLDISNLLNIKKKTVSSHKGNIKRKVKISNKQAIYYVARLTDTLTGSMFVHRQTTALGKLASMRTPV